MIQNQPYPIDSIVAEINTLCGPPPVLSTESSEAYQKLLLGLFATIRPPETLAQLFVRHLADFTWEVLRYTRHKTLLIERKHMQQHATEFDHAEALERGIEYAKELDDLLNAATARRDDVLAQLDRYLEFGLGGQRDIGFQPIPDLQPGKAAALISESGPADSVGVPERCELEPPPNPDGERRDVGPELP